MVENGLNVWVFLRKWVLLVTLSYLLIPPITSLIAWIVPEKNVTMYIVSYGLASGLLVGGAQWLVLRHYSQYLPQVNSWLMGSILAFVLGTLVGRNEFVTRYGHGAIVAVTGGCVGLLQGLSMTMYFPKSWLWIVANILGWVVGDALGLLVSRAIGAFWLFPVLGMGISIITGVAMVKILNDHTLV